MASSCIKNETRKGSVHVLEFAWTADTDGSFTDAVSDVSVNGIIQGIEIIPGTPSPTASYAVTVKNDFGRDILGGTGTSLSATLASALTPDPEGMPVVDSFLTLGLTGNSVNSAKGKVLVYVLEL